MSGPHHVLIVDDDDLVRRSIRRMLVGLGFQVSEAEDGEQGCARLAADHPEVALIDVRMPRMGGFEVLQRARELSPDTECIVITGHGDVSTATRFLGAGASDYFEKPVQDWPRFQQVLRRACEISVLRRENQALRDPRDEGLLFGPSPQMDALRARVQQLAPSTATVLIRGESGTGKDLVARTIHRRSGRKGAFVAVNCGAIPEALLESELFGHERGAHSTATEARAGLLSQAEGGTLLLDEIGDMPAALQVKLLRVLENRTYRPLGGTERPLSARILSATHRDLHAGGSFRKDLLYRLDVLRVDVPALRDHPSDVIPLVYRFIDEFNRLEGRSVQRLHPEALRALEEWRWPGNVRELRNTIHRAVVLCAGEELRAENLPTPVVTESQRTPSPAPSARGPFEGLLELPYGEAKEKAVEAFTEAYVRHHLSAAGGIITQAAERSGMARPNFSRLMRRYGIEQND